ncbi:taurine transporter subunit; ATP-binding component of ABC superfamily [uncultured delta proteobacterium]|uniref:Taurine transporter subunit ATP-binding component of ABC superfamily n=1 Tax=uncultured delta proteobacterium TaxID=34034 RepID=A0A212JWM2_9DELT|nr:taurine transporter subunit; ATP-binding component of ABC superfamily [uncultured delta proteobacterium]
MAVTPLALELVNVEKVFPGSAGGAPVRALSGFSLAVAPGEYVALLGESGCGKSTLLALAAGLTSPDAGQVFCEGREVKRPDRHRMLMFQEDALFPWLDVLGNVLYGLSFVPGLTNAHKKARALEFLDMVGLANFRHFRVHELSGGMRQRAALARALAPDPHVLLMDEPFSALDAMTREQLYADLQRIWQETGKTVVMVTHNVREAVCLSGRVVLMAKGGRLVADERVNLQYPRCMNDVALAETAGRIQAYLQTDSEKFVAGKRGDK